MSESMIYVNVPTAAEALASELQDIAHRVDAVRFTEDLSGVGANQMYIIWKDLVELCKALTTE